MRPANPWAYLPVFIAVRLSLHMHSNRPFGWPVFGVASALAKWLCHSRSRERVTDSASTTHGRRRVLEALSRDHASRPMRAQGLTSCNIFFGSPSRRGSWRKIRVVHMVGHLDSMFVGQAEI